MTSGGRRLSEVFVLWHTHPGDAEPPELIGVYTSRTRAVAAALRLAGQPGFRDLPRILSVFDADEGGFHVDSYVLDRNHWTEGHDS